MNYKRLIRIIKSLQSFLEDGISLVDEDGSKSVKKAKLKDVESKPMPGDVQKKTGQEDLSSGKDDDKKIEKDCS